MSRANYFYLICFILDRHVIIIPIKIGSNAAAGEVLRPVFVNTYA